MSEAARFQAEVAANVAGLKADPDVQALSRIWLREITRYKYAYNFTWMGRPAIQFPQDLVAMQELIWRVRPDLVVETGVAHGGSVIFKAAMLELLGGAGRVVGIDVDIRPHNRAAIEGHPLARRVTLIEGSSTDPGVVRRVGELAAGRRVLVALDSDHTHDHVLRELRAYAPLVGAGSYVVVYDTAIEDMPDDLIAGRAWGKGNNPKTAVREFLRTTDRFRIDRDLEAKLLITACPDGYLECVND